MKELEPGEYTSDDLDRLVREADRKAAKLRHLGHCAECGSSLHGTELHERLEGEADPYADPFHGDRNEWDEDEDDGFRYDPVEGESRIVECPYKMCGGH